MGTKTARAYQWILERLRLYRGNRSLLLLLVLVLVLGVVAAAFFQFRGGTSGETLRINLATAPKTLDPQRAESEPERTTISQCLQGLVGYDETLSLRTVVARNFSVSEDGLNYTFLIKKEARWHDGKPVTAQDFVYAFQRLFTEGSPNAFLYLDIKGALQYHTTSSQGRPGSPEALGVKAIGERTLHITLERPVNHFLHLLTLWPTYPVRRDIIEQYGKEWARPKTYPCNGPFVLKEWTSDAITLERNKKYWGPKPYLKQIRASFIPSEIGPAGDEWLAYLRGDLDIIDVIFGPGAGTEKERKEWERKPRAHTAALLFNTRAPPLDNVKVRQAIATALDRDGFITKELGGIGKAALAWMPPGLRESEPNLGLGYQFSPPRARELLAEAGYPNGQGLSPLLFQYEETRSGRIIAGYVADWVGALGIKVQLEPLNPEEFQRALKGKRFTFTFIDVTPDFYAPASWFVPFFRSDGPFNYSGYANPTMDQLIQQATSTREPLEALRLWRQVHQQLVADVPIAPFFHEERTVLVKSRVKQLTITPIDGAAPGDLFFSRVRLVGGR